VKYGTSAAFAVGVDQPGDRGVDAGLAQRCNDEIALPRPIIFAAPMLDGAAAADAEMRTDRRDAFGARRLDGEKLPPVGTSTVSPGNAPGT